MRRCSVLLLLFLCAFVAACGGDDDDEASSGGSSADPAADEPTVGDAEPMTWEGAAADPVLYCTGAFDLAGAVSGDEYSVDEEAVESTGGEGDVFCSARNVTQEVDFLFTATPDEGDWAAQTWEWESVEDISVPGADEAKWIEHGGDRWLEGLAGGTVFVIDPTSVHGDERDVTIAAAEAIVMMLPVGS